MRSNQRFSLEEEVVFFRRWQAMPDGRDKATMADRYLSGQLGLVRRVIVTRFKRFSTNAERFDELLGIGWAAMYQAMNSFEVCRQKRFSTYAVTAIGWAIQRELTTVFGVPVNKNLFPKMLTVGLGGCTGSAVADRQLADAYRIAQAVPLSTPVAGKLRGAPATPLELVDYLPNCQPSTEQQALANLRNQRLYRAIGELSKRERAVIVAKFFRGRTHREIGLGLSGAPVSRQRAQQLEKDALRKLRQKLDQIESPGP